jgi:hypothetical protein
MVIAILQRKGRMSGRWEFLEGVRAMTAAEAIVHEAAKLLAGELARWPPRVEWTDATAAARYAPLYADAAPRPTDLAVREGMRLARWEMERDVQAIDFYMRNDLAAKVTTTAHDRLALDLVWRYLTEAMLALQELCGGRLKRAHLIDCLLKLSDSYNR